MFPLIKDKGTTNNWSYGKTVNAKKEHLQILIPYEEHSIVEFMKNKSRCDHSLSRKHVGDLIVDNLKTEDHFNSKNCGSHKFVAKV